MENSKLESCFWAFIVAGVIGVITQAILQFYLLFVHDFMMAVRFTLFTHAALGSILAALGIYGKLESKSGMGAIVPIAGLAAAITGMIIGERASGKPTGQAIIGGLKVPLTILAIGCVLGLVGALICLVFGINWWT